MQRQQRRYIEAMESAAQRSWFNKIPSLYVDRSTHPVLAAR
jgi:hypothetical protein